MCGCQNSVPYSPSSARSIPQQASMEPCNYTVEILSIWRDKLICIKEQNKYNDIQTPEGILNSYLGVVISALNSPQSICLFKNELDIISATIIKIINLGSC